MAEPSLKPLTQWICDTCRDVILEPEHGWVEWVREKDRYTGFRICHHRGHSRLGGQEGCYKYGAELGRGDMHLQHVSADEGRYILSFLDVGVIHDPKGEHVGGADIRSWAELYRRLFVPHYEEARLYFSEAQSDGFYDEDNEVAPYREDKLIRVIREYKP